MQRIRKGDEVVVLAGRDKGKRGMPYPQRPPCWVSVFFNGAPVYRSDVSRGSGRPPDLARDFTVSSLESIEYYKGASDTPQQFGGANADCGALVLWSRR